MSKQTTILGLQGQLNLQVDDQEIMSFTAVFETADKGVFFGYGSKEDQALHQLKQNIKFLTSSKNDE